MKIFIIGLGLIGGSLAKALCRLHTVGGFDFSEDVMKKAESEAAITDLPIEEADLVIVAVPPKHTKEACIQNIPKMKRNAVITEVCGVKEFFSEDLTVAAKLYGVDYVGIHPMAGKEKFGYDYAESTLFEGRDFIIVKTAETTERALQIIYSTAGDINAGKITEISPMQHDAIIAYTSQLAHVVSSSYVKSRMLAFVDGFCGGSFQDMTRVAELDEDMWTDLFLMNRDNIMAETKQLTDSLNLFYDALNKGDREKLKDLLKNGRERKEHCRIR